MATGNVHAHARARAPLQDAFVAIRLHSTLDASEPQRRGNFSHVLDLTGGDGGPLPRASGGGRRDASAGRAAASSTSTSDLGYSYPGRRGRDAHAQARRAVRARLRDRYAGAGRVRASAKGRLEEELRIIGSSIWPGFFLLHHDLLELAREVAVEVRGPDTPERCCRQGVAAARAVSSIVCFLTGLSHVDPIANELLIGRFLNEELNALPDIDLDFPRDIREVLIPRVHERYGHERVGAGRGLPDVPCTGRDPRAGQGARVASRGDRARRAQASEGWDARGVGRETSRTLQTGRRRATAGVAAGSWLARLAAEAHGLPRHLSQHSGGMIVATRPLIDCCPVVPAAMEGRQIVQWDKDSCADAGFLKIDLLGLGMLSAVERCVEMIARTRSERIDLSRIPFDDPATLRGDPRADTTGVFQIESRAQMQSLRRTRPENLQDLTIQVAIVRPGPDPGRRGQPLHRAAPATARGPRLSRSPTSTLRSSRCCGDARHDHLPGPGARGGEAFAGFSPGEAEGLRRAMSRKRSEAAIQAYHKRFVDGRHALVGADRETARARIRDGPGFRDSASPRPTGRVRPARVPVDVAARPLRPRVPVCAVQRAADGLLPPGQPRARGAATGIEVWPDVNARGASASSKRTGACGSASVTSVASPEEVAELVAERERGGRFRTGSSSRRGGDGAPRSSNWPGRARATRWSRSRRSPAARGACCGSWGRHSRPRRPGGTQLALPIELPDAPALRALDRWQQVLADYATSGVTVNDHAMALLRPRLPSRARHQRASWPAPPARGCGGRPGGRPSATGHGQRDVFVLLEDECGTVNLIVPAAVYERHRRSVADRAADARRGQARASPRRRVGRSTSWSTSRLDRRAG